MRFSLLATLGALVGCLNHAEPRDTRVEAVAPPAPLASDLPRDLRVVAFNVHMEPGEKIADALRNDPQLRGADLIFFEEIHRSNLGCSGACEVGRELGFSSVYAPGGAAGDGDDGIAILSRSPISNARVIVLPHFDVHINSARRVALAATIEVAGKPVTVYAVHLENRLTVRDRRTQMLPVLEDAARQTTPVIIGGDLNTSPFTWIAHLIPVPIGTQDDHMEALARSEGFDTPVKDTGPTSRFFQMKLDAIYTRGFATQRFATAEAGDLSDHLAVWAVMSEKL
jgi:endonuclease/exonuclease/phosphatase family metal-dependent hydrolase